MDAKVIELRVKQSPAAKGRSQSTAKGISFHMNNLEILKSALDAIEDEIILIIDKDAKICYSNDAYYKTVGFTREESIGQPLLTFRPDAKIVNVLQYQKKELRVIREADSDDVLCNLYPIVVDGSLIGAISVSRTIGEVLSDADYVHKHYSKGRYAGDSFLSGSQLETTFEDIIAVDPLSVAVVGLARKIAPKDIDVLLVGESGTGKERFAQAIHSASDRKERQFVAINCATLHDNLLESELFGYEGGSFTGAIQGGKAGIFEMANGGTVFLDEISELDYGVQSRLLRVLQERKVRRIGGTKEISINVRVISATNTLLEARLEAGRFRKDLYYRIAPFVLDLPPLKERKKDIPLMIRHFLVKHENKMKGRIDISPEAKEALMCYHWDGNIRELQNAIEHATAIMSENTIHLDHLPKRIQDAYRSYDTQNRTLKERVMEFEREEIEHAIEIYGDTLEGKRKAAEVLGISLANLYKKLKPDSEI